MAQRFSSRFLILLFLALFPVLGAGSAAVAQDEEGRNVVLEGTHGDMQFLAGRTVRVQATVNDDVFVAGRDVTFDQANTRNAYAAGYDVDLQGGQVADMVSMGANVTIGGSVDDDLLALGRSVRVTADGSVGGDANMAGETLTVEGAVTGNLRAAARRITINGKVGGKVDIAAQRIVVGPNAVIEGDLIYRSGQEPEIAAGATINGETRRIQMKRPDFSAIIGFGIALVVGWALSVLALVALLQWLLPGVMRETAARIRLHPWSSLGLGIVFVLLGKAIAVALLFSVFAIPMGLAIGFTLAVVWLLALAGASLFVGLMIRRAFGRVTEPGNGGRVGWAVIGTIVIFAVSAIPIVGWVVAVLVVAAGFGAMTLELWRRLRAA